MEVETEAGETSQSLLRPVELKFNVPWGHIAGKAWYNPNGQPVLCVHGIQDNAGTFDHLIPQLPSSFYYVCIDLPGHGQSSHFPSGIPLDFMDYVQSVMRVLDQLQWKSCYYIGHSLGGQLGVYICSLWSQRVKKLVLLDALAPMFVDIDKFLKRNKDLLHKILVNEEKFSEQVKPSYSYEEAFHKMMHNRNSQLTEEGAKTLMKRSLTKKNSEEFNFTTDQRLKLGLWPMISQKHQLQLLNELNCPTLALLTDLRRLRRWRFLQGTFELLKNKHNFQFIDIDGNHEVHINNPERVAPLITEFFTKTNCVL